MKYIEDFKEGEHIVGHYLCKQRQSLKTKAGKNYLSLKLRDKTGMIDAKVWEMNNAVQSFEEGDFIKVDGSIELYQGTPQMRVTKIRKSCEGEYEPTDYIPCTDKDIGSLWAQILDYVRQISNPYIKRLLENILVKDENVGGRFKESSAARNMHHSYMGGLAEHTLNVTQLCDYIGGRYKFVNRDILIASAILHDIGKIYELSPFPENEYTDDGQLLGHIVIGAEMIAREADKIDGFPHQLKTALMHCVLAHHGEYEFGSPKLPKLIEAMILHSADNMDAKLKMIEEALESNTQGAWTQYQKMFDRNFRKSVL